MSTATWNDLMELLEDLLGALGLGLTLLTAAALTWGLCLVVAP